MQFSDHEHSSSMFLTPLREDAQSAAATEAHIPTHPTIVMEKDKDSQLYEACVDGKKSLHAGGSPNDFLNLVEEEGAKVSLQRGFQMSDEELYRWCFQRDLMQEKLEATLRLEYERRYEERCRVLAHQFDEQEAQRTAEIEMLKATLKTNILQVKESLKQHQSFVKENRCREKVRIQQEEEQKREIENIKTECNRVLLQTHEVHQIEIQKYKGEHEDLERRYLHLEARCEAQQIAYDTLMRKYLALQEVESTQERTVGFSNNALTAIRAELKEAVRERDRYQEQVSELRSSVTHYRTHLIETVDLYNNLLNHVNTARFRALEQEQYLFYTAKKNNAKREKKRSMSTFASGNDAVLRSNVLSPQRVVTTSLREPNQLFDYGTNTNQNNTLTSSRAGFTSHASKLTPPTSTEQGVLVSAPLTHKLDHYHGQQKHNEGLDTCNLSVVSSLTTEASVSDSNPSQGSAGKYSRSPIRSMFGPDRRTITADLISSIKHRVHRYDDILNSL